MRVEIGQTAGITNIGRANAREAAPASSLANSGDSVSLGAAAHYAEAAILAGSVSEALVTAVNNGTYNVSSRELAQSLIRSAFDAI